MSTQLLPVGFLAVNLFSLFNRPWQTTTDVLNCLTVTGMALNCHLNWLQSLPTSARCTNPFGEKNQRNLQVGVGKGLNVKGKLGSLETGLG